MPKERESELKHLGGKVFHQIHSSCVKKIPTNHQKEFDVLSDLRDLSDKSDQLAETKLPADDALAEWFQSIRTTILNIRDCKSVKDIQYPPSIETFIVSKDKDEKLVSPSVEATPILKMTASSENEKVVASSANSIMTHVTKLITPEINTVASNTQMITPAASIRKKANPTVLLHQLTDQETTAHSTENFLKNNLKPVSVMLTPILNRTFEKMNTTVVIDSGSSKDRNQASNTVNSSDDSVFVRSGSKKKKENECPNSHGMLTRSGSKRKSSTKNKANKKQKIDSINSSSVTSNKTAKSRRPLRDLKSSVLATENKNKLSAVVKPPVKPPAPPKELQILEELKKKEKKVEENMQKIKAQRQQKAEQNKKIREEKQSKTLQKRLQMEKEKEEKREMGAKISQTKINKENPKKTTKAKELVEQHVKESKSSIVTSSTQSTSSIEVLVKTPASRKSDDIQSYELTPVPDSSTYNFSDDEEEKTTNKRIPTWAQGVQLKSALMTQFYYPVDTDEIFGSIIEPPNLVDIFNINKKRYLKRTSSAVWSTPPDRSYHL